jgi:hypothetical protein
LNANASVYRIELPDGNYEVVPESEGEPAEGEVNVVNAARPEPKFKGNPIRLYQWREAPEHNLLLLTYAIHYAVFVHLCS